MNLILKKLNKHRNKEIWQQKNNNWELINKI